MGMRGLLDPLMRLRSSLFSGDPGTTILPFLLPAMVFS